VLTARAAVAWQTHDHTFGEVREREHHDTAFGEVALRGTARRQTWVVRAAAEQDTFQPQDVPQFAYRYTVPGVFAQDDLDLTRWLAISASGRLDDHSQDGTFFNPRLSALVRSGRWNSRLSVGTGLFAPTPLTEETEAAGLSRLTIPQPLKAERGQSASFDFGRTDGPVTYTATLFKSRIRNPVKVDVTDAYVMTNLPEPTTNLDAESC
jgi:outer membrane receptor for ferrienterochelin and colicins